MKLTRFKYLRITILVLTTTLWWFHCTTSTVATDGGSEVWGKLERADGTPVGNANVRALIITDMDTSEAVKFDTAVIENVVSDASGEFKFLKLKPQVYVLDASYKNDSLRLVQSVIFEPNPTERVNLGALVMKAPGAIRGTVLLTDVGGPNPLITCYIAGTSFDAHTDRATRDFTISGIFPVDTFYELTISADGYRTVSITGVPVKGGERTNLADTIRLTIGTDGVPPMVAPAELSVSYDTMSGTAHLSWHPVPVEDVVRYIVYSTIGSSGRSDTVSDTTVAIKIFSDNNDTTLRMVTFQISALDDEHMEGPRGKIDTLSATPPAWLQVKPVIAKLEGRGSLDTAFVVLSFTSKVRHVDTISWWVDSPDSVIRKINGPGQKTGTDTLRWLTSVPKMLLGVTLTDNSGAQWSDSLNAATLLPSDKWTFTDSLKNARRYACANVVGGKVYVFGGCVDKMDGTGDYLLKAVLPMEMYDPKTGSWKTLNGRLNHCRFKAASAVVDGKIYIFGGTNNATDFTSIEEYDVTSDSWRISDSLPGTLVGAVAYVTSGRINLTGGMGTLKNGLTFDTVFTYDPRSHAKGHSFTLRERPRVFHQVVTNGSQIIVLGGLVRNPDDSTFYPMRISECFDGINGTSCTMSTLNFSYDLFGFGAVATGKKLIIFGGKSRPAVDSTFVPVKRVDVYSFEDRQLQQGQNLPTALEGVAVAELDGRVYVIGGGNASQKSTKSVYVYYP